MKSTRSLTSGALFLLPILLLSSCDSSKTELPANTTPFPVTSEVINGIMVPLEPDPIKNNATLAGIDSNNNGVRDDVERKIAKSVDSTKFSQAMKEASLYLKTLEKQSSKLQSLQLTANILCAENENTSDMSGRKIIDFILNTEDRRKANRDYVRSAGAFLSDKLPECN